MRRNIKSLLEQASHLKNFQDAKDLFLYEFKNLRLLLEAKKIKFNEKDHIFFDEIKGKESVPYTEWIEDYNDLLVVKNTLDNRLISNTDNQNRSIEIQDGVLMIKSSFNKS